MRVKWQEVLDDNYFVRSKFESDHDEDGGVDVIYYIQQYVRDGECESDGHETYVHLTPMDMEIPSDITNNDVYEWFKMDCWCSHDCCGHMFTAYAKVLSADNDGVYALVAYRKNV